MDASPRLPPELERDIFERSAFTSRQTIPNLLLVAHRVHLWIQPILYDVLVVSLSDDNPTPSETRSNAFLANAVHHLSISSVLTHERLLPLLNACQGTQTLALWASFPNPTFLPLLQPMALTHLVVDVQYLFGGPLRLDIAHPCLHRLTHLDVIRPSFDDWRLWNGLAQMPALTHLAFRDGTLPRVFAQALIHCKNLRALGVVWDEYRSDAIDVRNCMIVDARFFMVVIADQPADWIVGARGGRDFWKRAEELIRSKEAGDLNGAKIFAERFIEAERAPVARFWLRDL